MYQLQLNVFEGISTVIITWMDCVKNPWVWETIADHVWFAFDVVNHSNNPPTGNIFHYA